MNIDLNIERISFIDNRKINSIRMDRNEKVVDYNPEIFQNIFKNIEKYEFTSYPKDNFTTTYNKIIDYLNINMENLTIHLGADDVIREIFLMFNDKIKVVGILEHTYGMYKVYSNLFKKNIVEIPYIIDLNNDINNICKLDKQYLDKVIMNLDIIFFVNPNQVSNNDLSLTDIENYCNKYKNKLFIIDEAYYGFGNFSCLELIKKYKNIFIIRSFSKTFGLASIRLGLLIGNKISMKPFQKIQPIYSMNLFTAKICNYFIDNINLVNDYNNEVIKGREWFVEKLRINNYKVIDPLTLSVIIVFNNSETCDYIYDKCIENLFYIKKININNFKCLRITCAPKYLMKQLYNKCFKTDIINTNYCKYLYDTRGYFIINDVYNNDEINNILNEIKQLDYSNYIETGSDNNLLPFRLEYFTKNNKIINDIIFKKKYIDILNKCLNTNSVSLFKDKFICKSANNNKTLKEHVDGIFYTYNYRLNKKTMGWYTYAKSFIQYGIFLTDNTKDNGAIYIDKIRNYNINDFHKKFIGENSTDAFIKKNIMEELDIYNTAEILEGKKGSVVIFNPSCIHFGYKNSTNKDRINLYLTFNKTDEGDNYDLALHDKLLLLKNIGLQGIEKRQNDK